MKVGVGADHGGFEMKEQLAKLLTSQGHEVIDFGNKVLDRHDDYPDFAIPLARAVANGDVERGILVCGSGVGASVAANKIGGARAALCHDHFSARQGVEGDNSASEAGPQASRLPGTARRTSWAPASAVQADIVAVWPRSLNSKSSTVA
jgi:RpiB/LacA/LacB family sugar-phosphate isomerase